jgi:hypothetical protein
VDGEVGPQIAMKTLCGHQFCAECLDRWRLESVSGIYTCPMCRRCLVCGAKACSYHKLEGVEDEDAIPTPLSEFLNAYADNYAAPHQLPGPLYNISADDLRDVREDTRQSRIDYTRHVEARRQLLVE